MDVVAGGLYGLCVSLDGNTAVIGAQRPCEAEVFVNNNGVWSLQSIIQGPEDSDFRWGLFIQRRLTKKRDSPVGPAALVSPRRDDGVRRHKGASPVPRLRGRLKIRFGVPPFGGFRRWGARTA